MILRQLLHRTPTIGISYVLGCPTKHAGAVVDPMAAPEMYLAVARDSGIAIRYVIDTHVHADHLSTGRELAAVAGAEYVLHESVESDFAFRGVADGERLDTGNTRLDVLHLPGHTPEHIGLLITDRVRSDEPWFVLTGHTLMVGDMGRTELASSARDGAHALYRSATRLRSLADHIEVMPGAYAGSVCGRGLSGKTTTTIGFERRYNRTFSIQDEPQFVEAMLKDIPPPPPSAAMIRAANLGHQRIAA
jgi:hydroxyacylglutathione hydrolase